MNAIKGNVVVWKTRWLAASETFIRNQSDGLRSFRALPTGFVKINSPLVRETDKILTTAHTIEGKSRLWALRLTGRSGVIKRYLKSVAPSLVHAHFVGNGIEVWRSAKAAGLPLVVTLHGNDVTGLAQLPGWRGIRYRRRMRELFREAALLIAVSGPIRECAIALGAHPDKVITHHMGIPRPEKNGQRSQNIDVLFVGRLVEKKGVDDLLKALADVERTHPNLRSVVIGDGPLSAELQDRAQEYGCKVDFRGSQPPEKVRAAMLEARMLAVPSKTASNGDMEGLPTVVVEAAAIGLPVVGYDHSGIPEAVISGETGLLATEGDWPRLAEMIRSLLADDELRNRLGNAAKHLYQEEFDMSIQCQRLESIYEAVIQRKRLGQ